MGKWQLGALVAGLVGVLVLAAVVGAVVFGGDDDPADAVEGSPSSEPEPTTTTASSTGPSPDCELAVRNWLRAARGHVIEGVFGVPFEDSEATAEPTDRVSVYCAPRTWNAVSRANLELAYLNAGLIVCETVPANCARAETDRQLRKVRRMVERIEAAG